MNPSGIDNDFDTASNLSVSPARGGAPESEVYGCASSDCSPMLRQIYSMLEEISVLSHNAMTRLNHQERELVGLSQRLARYGYSGISEDLAQVKENIDSLMKSFANSADLSESINKLHERLVKSNVDAVLAGRKVAEGTTLTPDEIITPLAAWINQILKARMQFKFRTINLSLSTLVASSLFLSLSSLFAITIATVSLTLQLQRLEALLSAPSKPTPIPTTTVPPKK